MSQKQAYEQKMDAQLKEWKAKIDQLQAKAEQAEADQKIRYNEQVSELRAKQQVMEEKLHELRNSGENAWEELKQGMDAAWEDLKGSVDRAGNELQ